MHQIIQEQEIMYVMYMIWQVMYMNGQQRRPTILTFLASIGEAVTTAATITRAIATTMILPTATLSMVFAHFYLCSSERLSRVINI